MGIAILNKMKTFYAECSVDYNYKINNELISDYEIFAFILDAKNKKEAIIKVEKLAIERFIIEVGDDIEDFKVKIYDCYETSYDARTE